MFKSTNSIKKVYRKKLSLAKEDFSIKRHPSVKNLLNQIDNPEPPKFNSNLINIIASNNDDLRENGSENVNKEKALTPTNLSINIIGCEHKIVNDEDTFFIETVPVKKDNSNINLDNRNNKLMINKPLFYELSEEQKQFDKRITNLMVEGKDFETIEKQFQDILKK